MPPADSKPGRSGLSLYANLLNTDSKAPAPGTISSAPVVYKQPQQEPPTAEKTQISSAALRFQPTKRPQLASQKPKSKTPNQRPPPPPPSAAGPVDAPSEPNGAASRMPAKTLADWTAEADDDDVNGFYAMEKRQRGGRKKRKKNKEEAQAVQNWDDIYDPSRPNLYEDYKNSDEKFLEIREWKDRLYAHRMARRRSSGAISDSSAEDQPMNNRFAPPPQFAPPVQFSAVPPPRAKSPVAPPPPPPEPVNDSDEPSGEDAYLRRMGLSRQMSSPSIPAQPPHMPPEQPPPPPAAPVDYPNPTTQWQPPPPPPPASQAAISKAPVRYNLPPPPPELLTSETELENALEGRDQAAEGPADNDAPRSLRPGQKGFAERLMSKYGWSKGSGLGASGSGITAPLRVQLEKQKKKPDSEGGGFAGPGGMGKILGGKRKGGTQGQESKFGAMSEVIVLRGMLDGMNLDQELGAGDGGLMQEIGEECGQKYGRVERVFIDRGDAARASVFVKFTSQLSALRAVNALEGRVFNGNTITAKFFEPQKFEEGVYQ